MPVRKEPGSTRNARRPIGSSSCHRASVRPSSANLLDAYQPLTGRLAIPSMGGDVDDRAAAAGAHAGKHLSQQRGGSEEVDLELSAVVPFLLLFDRADEV